MPAFTFGVCVFLLIVAVVVLYLAVNAYNGLVNLTGQVDRAWANIDVILKQRHDVIPQILSVCEQYTQYERLTLDHIIEARKKYLSAGTRADQITADQQITQAMHGFLALGEAYPELKSSEQFVQLQNTIASLENQLSDRREVYNETVTNLNVRIMQFPDVFLAQFMGLSHHKLYEISPEERAPVSVQMKLPA